MILIASVQAARDNGTPISVALIGAIVGAVAVITVGVLNYFMQRRQLKEQRELFERQHAEQQEQFAWQLDQAHKQLDIMRDGQLTDRYTKAVDQLGEGGEVCIGGIYALGSIIRNNPEYELAVIAVLSAFVRRKGKVKDDGTVPWTADEAEHDEVKPSFAIQAALDVIGQQKSGGPLACPNLRDSDLRGARLNDTDLRGASLRRSCLWKAHLTGADLSGASLNNADLTAARLKDAKLAGANLKGARLTAGSLSPEQLETVENSAQIEWLRADSPTSGPVHSHPWLTASKMQAGGAATTSSSRAPVAVDPAQDG